MLEETPILYSFFKPICVESGHMNAELQQTVLRLPLKMRSLRRMMEDNRGRHEYFSTPQSHVLDLRESC